MRLAGVAILCFLIGAPAFGHQQQQQEQQQDERAKKKQQEEERQRQAQQMGAEKKQQEESAKREDKAKQDKQQQQIDKQQEKQQKKQEKPQRETQQRTRTGQERAGQPAGGQTRHGSRVIQQEKFQAHFGREHHFHGGIHRGDPRFVYGGYTFEYVEVWPAVWSYDDDFFIDFIDDDYYLCDFEHPEIRLVVIIVE